MRHESHRIPERCLGGGEAPYDDTVIPDASLDDVDPDAVKDYRSRLRETQSEAIDLTWSDEALLIYLGCVEHTGQEATPTIAGLLLFGKETALRRDFPDMTIEYIQTHEAFQSREICAPLLSAIRQATYAVMHDLQRPALPTLPVNAIREAVINAAMHRSYLIREPTQIVRYTNRLEFRNPGYSLRASHGVAERRCELRNPRIAAVLREARVVGANGSGIHTMRREMVSHGLSAPSFASSKRPDQFVATFLLHAYVEIREFQGLFDFSESGAEVAV